MHNKIPRPRSVPMEEIQQVAGDAADDKIGIIRVFHSVDGLPVFVEGGGFCYGPIVGDGQDAAAARGTVIRHGGGIVHTDHQAEDGQAGHAGALSADPKGFGIHKAHRQLVGGWIYLAGIGIEGCHVLIGQKLRGQLEFLPGDEGEGAGIGGLGGGRSLGLIGVNPVGIEPEQQKYRRRAQQQSRRGQEQAPPGVVLCHGRTSFFQQYITATEGSARRGQGGLFRLALEFCGEV